MTRHEAHQVATQARTTLAVLVILAVGLLAIAAVVVWAELREDPDYDPLHYTNPQTVTSRVNTLGGTPATHLDGTVEVTGEKCADEEVSVIVSISWKPVEPRASSVVTNPRSGSIREEGCVVSRFENAIPPTVVEAVQAQHDNGHLEPLWEIQGIETPIGPNGEGTPEVWVTEPFVILP